MSLLSAHELTKFYDAELIFAGVSVEIPQRARIALVGPNGAGKTTLVNILIGHDLPTEGAVNSARNLRIGHLPQRPELAGSHTLWEEQLRAFDDLRRMEAELAELERALADDAALLVQYGNLQARFEHAGGYTYESRIRMVLSGVGFAPDEYEMPLQQLSGGQKTRALLARLLLEEPDLLALDEPTNHLDIDAVEWLERFLRDYPGAVLIVSHDRYFMDAVITTIWELDFEALEVYRGNYSHYVRQRTARHERLLREYEAQQEFVAREEAYIRKNMGSRGTAQAKGRQKKLETLKKRGKMIDRPRRARRGMALSLRAQQRSGDRVLMTADLAVGYPDAREPLFHAPDITLYRGEAAALIGPNGAGKTTFLKTILKQIAPLAGSVTMGASVEVGYFAQAHERLDPHNRIVDEIISAKHLPVDEARHYLARFLFSGDDVFRPIATLSGGERGRVALAKLALSGANFLLLDEPTNHLDIASQEILQDVLAGFEGTVLLVSHDRYLIDALATQIWALRPGALDVFEGSYREYVAARNRQQVTQPPTAESARADSFAARAANGASHGLTPYQRERRIAELERRIHALERDIDELTAAISAASADGEAGRVRELGERYAQAEAELNRVMQEWESLLE